MGGSGGDKSSGPTSEVAQPKEVLIEGQLYDVSEFEKRHPGGTVIGLYTGNGIDATEAYNNFHVRSKKARTILNSIKHRPAPAEALKEQLQGQSALMKDFAELTRQLKAEGFFAPAPLHVLARLTEIVVMHAIGFYLLFATPYYAAGIVMLGVVSGRCGWLMHEGGHYSLTGHISTDRAIQIVLYGVGCGMSGGWWRSNHNKHHSMPQKLGADVDLDTLPLVAFTEKVMLRVKRIGKGLKQWVRIQAFLFPVITTLLVALGWQFYLHPRFIIRRLQRSPVEAASEGAALLLRYGLWTAFITNRFGLASSAAMYLCYNWVASNYIFINFAVSHTHLPVVPKDDTSVDWVRYAAVHTMNVSPGPLKFVSWWMSYLNFQIEHHLFPSMPQFRHPIISPRVKALLEKHGLPYDQRDYVSAMKVTFQNLHTVGHDIFYG